MTLANRKNHENLRKFRDFPICKCHVFILQLFQKISIFDTPFFFDEEKEMIKIARFQQCFRLISTHLLSVGTALRRNSINRSFSRIFRKVRPGDIGPKLTFTFETFPKIFGIFSICECHVFIRNFFENKYFLIPPVFFESYDWVESFRALTCSNTPPDEKVAPYFVRTIFENFTFWTRGWLKHPVLRSYFRERKITKSLIFNYPASLEKSSEK